MKTGRNEPCPCGSGKKYKKCYWNKEKSPEDLLWHQLSNAHDRLTDQLMEYARTSFSELVIPLAMHDFLVWPEEKIPRI